MDLRSAEEDAERERRQLSSRARSQRHGDSDEDADALPPGIKFLNSLDETTHITNRSRSSVYEMIAAGELEAIKDGRRILVTGKSIVERTRRLPRAQIGGTKAA